MPEKKPTFEWIIISSKGADLCLTDNQFEYYRDHREDGTVSFDSFEINPSFVVQSYRQPAEGLFDIYPCHDCYKNGYIQLPVKNPQDGAKYKECTTCKGTGLDFNYVQKAD